MLSIIIRRNILAVLKIIHRNQQIFMAVNLPNFYPFITQLNV